MAVVFDPMRERALRKLGIAVNDNDLYPMRLIDAETGDLIQGVTSLSIVSEVNNVMRVRVELLYENGMLVKV